MVVQTPIAALERVADETVATTFRMAEVLGLVVYAPELGSVIAAGDAGLIVENMAVCSEMAEPEAGALPAPFAALAQIAKSVAARGPVFLVVAVLVAGVIAGAAVVLLDAPNYFPLLATLATFLVLGASAFLPSRR